METLSRWSFLSRINIYSCPLSMLMDSQLSRRAIKNLDILTWRGKIWTFLTSVKDVVWLSLELILIGTMDITSEMETTRMILAQRPIEVQAHSLNRRHKPWETSWQLTKMKSSSSTIFILTETNLWFLLMESSQMIWWHRIHKSIKYSMRLFRKVTSKILRILDHQLRPWVFKQEAMLVTG